MNQLERQILHDAVVVCGDFERIIIALNVHSVAVVHVVASILVRAASPLDRNGQLDKVAFFADGIELPLVAVSEKRPTHQWQNRFWAVDTRQNADLTICGIRSALRADIDWHNNGSANVQRTVIAKWWNVWIQQHILFCIGDAVIRS